MTVIRVLSLALLIGFASHALAGDRTALQELLQDDVASGWIYDDIDEGYREAKASGKPLLVCFSCVP